MGELKVGKQYTYKNHVYEIVNFVRMRFESNDWIDAVAYKQVLEGSEKDEKVDTDTVYTLSRSAFEELFLPITLEIGDKIIAVSMGSILRVYEVQSVGGNDVNYKYASSNDIKGEVKSCSLISFNHISFDGRVNIICPDNSLSHINCVEYYFLSDNFKKMIKIKGKIELIRLKLISAYEAFGKIDTSNFQNEDILNKYNSEITELILQIQKDGYIKWPQSKKQ